MRKAFLFLYPLLAPALYCRAQDTLFVAQYPQKMTASVYVANNSLLLGSDTKDYEPNSPLTVGVGFSIKNTVVSARLGYAVADLQGKEYGRTKVLDFQLHNYGRNFIADVFVQNYKGFYTEKRKTITRYPDISIRQIGAEGTYLFNGKEFSAKAAFQQSEKQLQSAGSFAIGGGVYVYHLHLGDELPSLNEKYLDNIQVGVNGGYAYSWVVNSNWLLSGMATLGLNVGNDPESLKDVKLKVYPGVFSRIAASYNKLGYSVAFSMLIQNKLLYSGQGDTFTVTSLGMQLAFIKRFDGFKRE